MRHRPRRNRKNPWIREMIAETTLSPAHLIYPVFVIEGSGKKEPLALLPGQYRYSLDQLEIEIKGWMNLGLRHFALFPAVANEKKNRFGSESLNQNGVLATTIKRLKDKFPGIGLIGDVALDPYSSDGHDGLVEDGEIVNDASVELLAQMAVAQARWGVDWVAPSDMMDGRVGAIRGALDENGFTNTSILAYTAKFASSFYGPFREALASAPKLGDKKTYQMDFRNNREALREARLDVEEGADMIMVKPGLPYLDIIKSLKDAFDIPIAGFNVSGEYAMIKFAAEKGALDETAAIIECLTAFRRAGADAILTYFAPQAAKLFE